MLSVFMEVASPTGAHPTTASSCSRDKKSVRFYLTIMLLNHNSKEGHNFFPLSECVMSRSLSPNWDASFSFWDALDLLQAGNECTHMTSVPSSQAIRPKVQSQ